MAPVTPYVPVANTEEPIMFIVPTVRIGLNTTLQPFIAVTELAPFCVSDPTVKHSLNLVRPEPVTLIVLEVVKSHSLKTTVPVELLVTAPAVLILLNVPAPLPLTVRAVVVKFDARKPVPVNVNVPTMFGFTSLSPKPVTKMLFVEIVGDSVYVVPG